MTNPVLAENVYFTATDIIAPFFSLNLTVPRPVATFSVIEVIDLGDF
ncbi:hypothetical protein GN278_05265 [Rhodobacteraceae bacterium Araon29]